MREITLIKSIKSFSVGVKHHVNLGNYESMEIDAQVTIEESVSVSSIDDAMMALETLLSTAFQAHKSPSWFSEIAPKKSRK